MSKSKSVDNNKSTKYPYPSLFGSHSSMVNAEKTEALSSADLAVLIEKYGTTDLVVLTDEHGDYTTQKFRVDNRGADPNRYRTSRLSKLFSNHSKHKNEE